MKKITNKSMAKALGWKEKRFSHASGLRLIWSNGTQVKSNTPPNFITSIDAIMKEIKLRGLHGELLFGSTMPKVFLYNGSYQVAFEQARTEAMALCKALLKFLQENP